MESRYRVIVGQGGSGWAVGLHPRIEGTTSWVQVMVAFGGVITWTWEYSVRTGGVSVCTTLILVCVYLRCVGCVSECVRMRVGTYDCVCVGSRWESRKSWSAN